MAGRFSVEAVFRAVDRVTAPVTRMQNRVGRFSRNMETNFRRLNRRVDGFARGMRRGALAVTAALAITGGAMASVVNTGADFEQTLVNAATKFPGEIRKGTDAFEALEQAARRTGSTTEFTAGEAANALNFLAMAGFDAENAMAALPGIVDLATAASVDLATASDIATDSLGALNMLTGDAAQNQANLARVSDVYTRATTRANLTMEEMFEALKQGAPVGVAAGQSLETIATMTAKMADAGIKGERAGTGLKNIFLALNAPGSSAAQVMRRLGIDTANADGSIRDAIEVFQDFSRETAKLPDQTKMQVFNEIFGRIPIAAAINLTNAAESMTGFREELEGATGATEVMAGVMRDTVRGRLNSFKSAIEGVKISIFEMTKGPLADVIDQTTAWVRTNEDLIATNVGEWLSMVIGNFKEIVTWGKRIGIAVGVFLALSLVLKSFIVIMTAVNLVMAMNPIGLIVLGIVALIAAFAAAIYWFDEIKAAFMSVDDTIFVIGAAMLALVGGPIGMLIGAAGLIIKHWGGIKEFFGDMWDGITLGFEAAIDGLMEKLNVFRSAWDSVTGFGSAALSFVGLGGSDDADSTAGGSTPQVISPQERTALSIEETRSTSTSEVTIRDETGRAEITGGFMGPGVTLFPSGSF